MKKKIGRCKNMCYAEKDDCKNRKKCIKFQTKQERTKCKSSCTDAAFRCKYKCHNQAVGCAGDCRITCTAGVERCIMNSVERNRRRKRSLLEGNDYGDSQELKVIQCHKSKKEHVKACLNECCYNSDNNIQGERRLVVQQQQHTTAVPLPEAETENVEGCGDCPCCPDPDGAPVAGSFIQAYRQGANSYYCLTYENGWVVGENPSITKTQYESCKEYIIMKQKNNNMQTDNSNPGPEGTLWQQWD